MPFDHAPFEPAPHNNSPLNGSGRLAAMKRVSSKKLLSAMLSAAALVVVAHPQRLQGQQRCYTLVNGTDHDVVLNYGVQGGVAVGTGFIYSQRFAKNAQEQYCTPYNVIATVATPNTTLGGSGQMILGPGGPPAGTYRMVSGGGGGGGQEVCDVFFGFKINCRGGPQPSPPAPQFEAINIVTLGAQNSTSVKNIAWNGPMVGSYGADTAINDPPDTPRENEAVWTFSVINPPNDLAWSICYAAGESRPVEVYLNGSLLSTNAAAATTGGWGVENRKCLYQGRTNLRSGENTVRVHRNDVFPHIWRVTFNQTHP